jgi:UDP-galactopyranose mutase
MYLKLLTLGNQMRILIVGAGFSGAVIARQLAKAGHTISIIDKRDHIAGNCYDYTNEHGIRIHKYGAHLFHTNNKKVWNWLKPFSEWIKYEHRVLAQLSDGSFVPFPPNNETIKKVPKSNIIDTFYRPYSEKMWGIKLEELDKSIIGRIPMREDDSDLCFPKDKFQFLPKHGYNNLFTNILDHQNINIYTNTSFNKSMESSYDFIFNSMPIDEYFDYEYGPLPYRSIKFHTVTLPSPKLFPAGQINFTHSSQFTRCIEWKNFPYHGKNDCFSTITYEEPCDYIDNNMERYYPVKDVSGVNRKLYKKYEKMVGNKMKFIGRCGLYIYYDMHMAINSSLAIADKFIKESS